MLRMRDSSSRHGRSDPREPVNERTRSNASLDAASDVVEGRGVFVSKPPPTSPNARGSSSASKSASADEFARRAVVRQLQGPIAQCFRALMPELAGAEDAYRVALDNTEVLRRCFDVFAANRAAFASFLVDAHGAPVTDDATRLACGRSVNEVTGMAVRSAMRAFAERHFRGTAAVPPAAMTPRSADDIRRADWVATAARTFRDQRPAAAGPKTAAEAKASAQRFYDAIRDALDFAWQIEFFPIYVEIPPELFAKLGVGITRLDSVEKLQRLAQLPRESIVQAELVMDDPLLARDMMENNVLAAESVSQMDAAEFQSVNDALAHVDTKKKWDIFANKLTALMLGKDKRISKADIAALADYLDLLNTHALRVIFDLKLAREQIADFLATATQALGRELFLALFGPLPFFGTDDAALTRQRIYSSFVESTLKSLVSAVKQLTVKFKRDAPEFISECLKLVCEARRDSIAAELARLVPSAATG
jgi:hypothetical protein